MAIIKLTNQNANIITAGTFADARLSASSVTQHAQSVDLQPVKSDITALALREATNESSASFNLPNQHIDTFATDTLGTKTNVAIQSGYVFSATTSSSDQGYLTGNQTSTFTMTTNGTWEVAPGNYLLDGSTSHPANVTLQAGVSQSAGVYVRFDRGSGNSIIYTGVKFTRQGTATQNGGSTWVWRGGNDTTNWTNLLTGQQWGGANPKEYTWTNTTAYRYLEFYNPNSFTSNNSVYEHEWQVKYSTVSYSVGATGTAIQNTNTVGSAKTKVGGTMLYKNNQGTATLGTDLKVYFSCNGGTNWTEASSYSAITPVYSTGVKQVRLGETTCTSGTDVRYKVEWANQSAGSKETQLHGIGTNY